ncbi:alpha-amylase family glycosyl hydrolase [Dinoroseobacter sp. S375]|uniref:alpha-amylase family glycosyl hydrolase n=1 Tax=Dinoroseobacter sp. S375 TaxID=3415136 RepID=UPI003C7AF888
MVAWSLAPDRCLSNPTIYEVYPRSFRDTTGTGEGDLQGVIDGLDHIASLGVDAIWLAPVYPSPWADGGYDVSDHRGIDPRYGDLSDFDRLVAEAARRGLKIIMDMVLNHTSDQHPWFQAALAGDDAAAERYVWRDARPDGTPPNNWMSFFGGPAWRWEPRRSQYYLHQYLYRQPALDMRCPAVQEDHRDTLRFWRDRGVAGFRFDTVTAYFHDPELRDNPCASEEVRACVEGPPNSPYHMQDHTHDLLPGDCAAFMEKVRDWAGPDMWLMGECTSGNKAFELVRAFTGPDRLDALYTTAIPEGVGSPEVFAKAADEIAEPGALPWWFGCHDQPRVASGLGDGSAESARFHMALLAALPGPAFFYQGEELGLPQPDLDRDEIIDPFDLRFWPDHPGRDAARVPIPWTQGPASGFTSGTPWRPMRWDDSHSIAHQEQQDDSMLAQTRALLGARRKFGWAQARDRVLSAQDDLLEIRAQTDAGPLHAVFNFAEGSRPIPDAPEDPLFTQALEGGALGRWGFVIASPDG